MQQRLPLMTYQGSSPFLVDLETWVEQHNVRLRQWDLQNQNVVAECLLSAALAEVELGHNERAVERFHEMLDVVPETPLRPLIAFYLGVLRAEEIDIVNPSDRIPITAELFAADPEEAPEENER